MQKYTLLTLFVLTTVFFSSAQQKLVFSDTTNNKTVTVKQSDVVKFLYIGYLGQIEQAYGKIELITDSFVRFENNWAVRVNDIIGFRKFNKYRDILKPAVQIITVVGAIIAVPTIINQNPQFNDGQRIGISFGIGAVSTLINKLLFPSRIKNFMLDGWQVKVE